LSANEIVGIYRRHCLAPCFRRK